MKKRDTQIFDLITKEQKRQREQLQMIPSENYASREVREAVGSVFMNKYSEGQATKRYYQGNTVIDELELLVKKRALSVFGLSQNQWGVNVQALSGTPANLAVYTALLEPGDTIMPMFLPDGGHLSHGWIYKGNKITLTSKIWNIEFYHVDKKTRVFDYEQIRQQARHVKPKLIISGGTAYPREIDHKAMGEIAHEVDAYYLADIAHEAGLVAARVNSSPFKYADVVTMTTHKTFRGPRGALIFSKKELSQRIDRAVFPGLQGGPHNHTIAGIGVALYEAERSEFKEYAKQIVKNANTLADEFMKKGYDVVSGGTDKHLVLIDLRKAGVNGKIAAIACEQANIILNANSVPYDDSPPMYPSGIRLGTPALTTRGMKEKEMVRIAGWIDEVIKECKQYQIPSDPEQRKLVFKEFKKTIVNNTVIKAIGEEVKRFAVKFATS